MSTPTASHEPGATIGVEEEFHIVDPETGDLRAGARALLASRAEVEPELHRTMIETATDVHEGLATLREDLVARRGQLVTAARALGLGVVASGTVPGSGGSVVRVFPKSRYEWIHEEYRQLVAEQQVCACQVQVGVPDRDLAVRVTRRVRGWLPTLLAMSASSPMFRCADTGYASYRTVAISRWPTVGPPPDVRSADEYDRLVESLVGSGVIKDAGMIYYDARPSARYPTVEVRIADGCPDLDDVVLLAALSRALVATAAAAEGEATDGAVYRAGPLAEAPVELVRAATWRAARSGLEQDLVDPFTARAVPAEKLVEALLEHVRPDLTARGEWPLVRDLVDRLLARGTSAQRQRALLTAGASDAELVADLVATTAG
ncbi:glutamate--cysteine ligase [Luedemannella flava]|uniref:carboxylate-amine ligase n=1 Tax=Luedemannella flava TaxID=349316 RepID=UPI0031E07462